jgi:hypothetical protein
MRPQTRNANRPVCSRPKSKTHRNQSTTQAVGRRLYRLLYSEGGA